MVDDEISICKIYINLKQKGLLILGHMHVNKTEVDLHTRSEHHCVNTKSAHSDIIHS